MEQMLKIVTGKPEYDRMVPIIRGFLEKNLLVLNIDGKMIRGYRSPDSRAIWIRDYSDILRGIRYFEKDLKSTIEHFAETQADNGRIFDFFSTFPDRPPYVRENWTRYVRIPVEADVEYRFVKAAYLSWQATGDDEWINGLMPVMDKALKYVINHPWRWDKMAGLVKRPYTIDTWDFAYCGRKHEWLQFQVDDNTFWGFMHGDCSGYVEAFRIMSFIYSYFGEHSLSEEWGKRANELEANLNRICWNGRFYTHFVRQSGQPVDGVEEANQLSLSNPVNINRGVTTHEMAVSILREYQSRKKKNNPLAEWYSIDPPFPAGIFGDDKLIPGTYVNGGIMPLVGGELAHAAFEHGFEKYGIEILNQYYRMITEKGESYLWYFPDGTPSSVATSTSPEAQPADSWGSSSMLYALVEGLAGVTDLFKELHKVRLAPRWYAAGVNRAEVCVTYPSAQGIKYIFSINHKVLKLQVSAHETDIDFHLLLPSPPTRLFVNGNERQFSIKTIEKSIYIDFQASVNKEVLITIELQ